MTLHIKAQNSTFGKHLVFERIGSSRLCQNDRFRAAARLESLSRVSLRESEAPGFRKTTVLRAAARLESLSRVSFESCRQAGILISGLFERIGSSRFCQNHRFRAAARLESLSRVSLRESETPGFRKTTVLRAAARLESLSRVSLRESEAHDFAYLRTK